MQRCRVPANLKGITLVAFPVGKWTAKRSTRSPDPIRLCAQEDAADRGNHHHAATHERVLHSVPQAPKRYFFLGLRELRVSRNRRPACPSGDIDLGILFAPVLGVQVTGPDPGSASEPFSGGGRSIQ